jgi:hypothetical protein
MLPDLDEIAKRDPQVVIERILQQRDNPDRHEIAMELWREWGKRDAVAAAQWGSARNVGVEDIAKRFRPSDETMRRLMKKP